MTLTKEDRETRRKIATEMVASNSFEQVYYKTELNYLDTIAALEAERDALREALEDISQYWNGLENPKATHDACEHNLRVATLALSTPANGEPARKP